MRVNPPAVLRAAVRRFKSGPGVLSTVSIRRGRRSRDGPPLRCDLTPHLRSAVPSSTSLITEFTLKLQRNFYDPIRQCYTPAAPGGASGLTRFPARVPVSYVTEIPPFDCAVHLRVCRRRLLQPEVGCASPHEFIRQTPIQPVVGVHVDVG